MSMPQAEEVMPDPLEVCPANAKTWVLLEDFRYEEGKTSIVVPKGFETDFASIPRFLWQLLPQWGLYGWAALIHDYLYSAQHIPRWKADRILLRLMGISRVPHWQRYVIFGAVWFFGCWAWMSHRRGRRDKVHDIESTRNLESRDRSEHREAVRALRIKEQAKRSPLRMIGATIGYLLLLAMFFGGAILLYGAIRDWSLGVAYCLQIIGLGCIVATMVCFIVERRISNKLIGDRPTQGLKRTPDGAA
jgi:hypothetical protein